MFDIRERESDRLWGIREDCKLRLAGENATLIRPLPGWPPTPSSSLHPADIIIIISSFCCFSTKRCRHRVHNYYCQAVHFRFAIWTRQTYIRPGAPLPGPLNTVPPLDIQDTRYAHTDIPTALKFGNLKRPRHFLPSSTRSCSVTIRIRGILSDCNNDKLYFIVGFYSVCDDFNVE